MLQKLSNYKRKLFAEITSIPEILQPAHLSGLDGLRGISIIIVILSHIFLFTAKKDNFNGNFGVHIFFVISGFLITSLLIKEKIKTKKISLKDFYIRRLFRIIPVAYLFIITVIILNYILKMGIHNKAFIPAAIFVENIPYGGFYDSHNDFYNPYVQHFWSLSVEEQFYLTFPFLFVYNFNNYLKTIIILIMSVSLIQLLGFNKVGVFYTNHVIHLTAFLIINVLGNTVSILVGSFISILLFKGFLNIKYSKRNKYVSFLLFVFTLLINTGNSIFFIPNSDILLTPVLIGIIIVLNLNEKSAFNIILNNRILSHIGMISYSLYIWQQLFTLSPFRIIPFHSIVLQLIILFFVANISYFSYERFFLNMKKRYMLLVKTNNC